MTASADLNVTPEEIAAAKRRFPKAFRPPPRVRAIRAALSCAALLAVLLLAWRLDMTPARLIAGADALGAIGAEMLPPRDGGVLAAILLSLGETLAMALLGTLLACVVALPLGLVAARNVVRSRALHFVIRRVFDLFRGVPTLIWALIFVRATGLGPMAGVLAMAAGDVAALAKLNAEAIEAVDARPIEAVTSAGASMWMGLRFGVAPQVAPAIVSQALYAFEANVRAAAVLGVVGAGGIGADLQDRIRLNAWNEAAFIVLVFVAAVAIIDFVSQQLRNALIGKTAA